MKDIGQFITDVKTNPELQKRLAAIDAARESDDVRAVFESMLPEIRQAGYDFTYEDMQSFAKAQAAEPGGEMSLEELDAVAGGGGQCWGIGFGGSPEVFCMCFLGGFSVSKNDKGEDVNQLNCILTGF